MDAIISMKRIEKSSFNEWLSNWAFGSKHFACGPSPVNEFIFWKVGVSVSCSGSHLCFQGMFTCLPLEYEVQWCHYIYGNCSWGGDLLLNPLLQEYIWIPSFPPFKVTFHYQVSWLTLSSLSNERWLSSKKFFTAISPIGWISLYHYNLNLEMFSQQGWPNLQTNQLQNIRAPARNLGLLFCFCLVSKGTLNGSLSLSVYATAVT